MGKDDRGVELEIVALDLSHAVVVIHVMPTALTDGSEERAVTAKPRSRKVSAAVGRHEVLRDSQGRVVDDEYVDRAVEGAIAFVRGRGRPSLSESGESPLLRVRVSRDLDVAVRAAAERSGESVSAWIRHVLERASLGG
jgi:hypothetical protein